MIIPFINFAGQAEEAIAFYETVFDVQNKQILFYKDMPADIKQHFPPETYHYVLHAEMTVNGTLVWIGDSSQGVTPGNMVSIAVPLVSKETVQKTFDKLKAGGMVLMDLSPTFYSQLSGMVKDKFGVVWHLVVNNIN